MEVLILRLQDVVRWNEVLIRISFHLLFIGLITLFLLGLVCVGDWIWRKFYARCSFCWETKRIGYKCDDTNGCVCSECFEHFISFSGEQGRGTPDEIRRCPISRCYRPLTLETIRKSLSREKFNLYCNQLTEARFRKDRSYFWCRCGSVFQFDCETRGSSSPNLITCPGCKKTVCSGCSDVVELRKKHVCRPVQGVANSRQCPTCRIIFVRVAGCQNMRCSSCNAVFKTDVPIERKR